MFRSNERLFVVIATFPLSAVSERNYGCSQQVQCLLLARCQEFALGAAVNLFDGRMLALIDFDRLGREPFKYGVCRPRVPCSSAHPSMWLEGLICRNRKVLYST